MSDSVELVLRALERVEHMLDDLPRRILINADQIFVSEGLSDISQSLGTLISGEMRVGNNKEPGYGFNGVRIAYPTMTYNGEEWNFVGLENDVLQVGIRASNGKFYAGGGSVIIDENGMYDADYVSGSSGWKINTDGSVEFANALVRGELRSAVFAYNELHGSAGTLGIFKSSGKLLNDVTTVAAPTTFDVDLTDPESGHVQLFEVGDILRIKMTGDDNWFTVQSVSDQTTFYRYTCVLSNGAVAAFTAGAGVIDYGQSGHGHLIMTADEDNAPYYSVRTHSGTPWSAINEVVRLGNLNEMLDYITDVYGIAIGDSENFMTYDPVQGLRVRGEILSANDITYGFNIWMEDAIGTKDGSNASFSGSQGIINDTLAVVRNGSWMNPTDDFSFGASSGGFSLTLAPRTGDILRCSYRVTSGGQKSEVIPVGAVDGSNLSFSVPDAFEVGTLAVFLNGSTLEPIDEYTEFGSAITLITAPEASDKVQLCYQTLLNSNWVYWEIPSGDIDGVNTSYAPSNAVYSTALMVLLNGMKQNEAIDYNNLNGYYGSGVYGTATYDDFNPVSSVIEFINPPQTNDKLYIHYRKV